MCYNKTLTGSCDLFVNITGLFLRICAPAFKFISHFVKPLGLTPKRALKKLRNNKLEHYFEIYFQLRKLVLARDSILQPSDSNYFSQWWQLGH